MACRPGDPAARGLVRTGKPGAQAGRRQRCSRRSSPQGTTHRETPVHRSSAGSLTLCSGRNVLRAENYRAGQTQSAKAPSGRPSRQAREGARAGRRPLRSGGHRLGLAVPGVELAETKAQPRTRRAATRPDSAGTAAGMVVLPDLAFAGRRVLRRDQPCQGRPCGPGPVLHQPAGRRQRPTAPPGPARTDSAPRSCRPTSPRRVPCRLRHMTSPAAPVGPFWDQTLIFPAIKCPLSWRPGPDRVCDLPPPGLRIAI